MCYISCLTIYYIAIPIKHNMDRDNLLSCTLMGYFLYYFGLATFFWLNVMCFEICRKIVQQSTKRRSRSEEYSTFVKFCLYGFVCPLIVTFFMFLLDHTAVGNIMDEKYHPRIGLTQDNDSRECFVQCKCGEESRFQRKFIDFLFQLQPVTTRIINTFTRFCCCLLY